MKTCDYCNAEFASEYQTKIYCSSKCRERAKKERQAHRRTHQEVSIQLYCRGCGQLFETRHKQIRYCSKDCRFFYLKQKRRDRRDQSYRVVSKTMKEKLLENSDGKCMLCGSPIDPELSYPNKESFSVDHIIPRSLNGDHTLSNLQAAHLHCNRKKGNKMRLPIDGRP